MAGGQALRVAVIGAGAFGRNHLRVLRELQQAGQAVELVAVVDRDSAAVATASEKFGVPGFATIEACLAGTQSGVGRLDAASVCVPTVHHASAAAPLLAAGVDLLIEKPLAASLADADSILELARRHGRIVQVGHLERFNPAVTAAREHLHKPMFFEAHRLSIFTPRSLDVDVVLDLMIHDLDIVLSLVASPVREVRAVGLPVLSRKVDIANVRVEFESGCIANFTASRVSTERVRKLRFFQPHQYLSLDFARQDLLMIDVTAAAGMDPAMLAALAEKAGAQLGAHPSAGLSLKKVTVELGEPLRLEIEAFLQAVRERTRPVVSGEDGRAALALALEINEAIAVHAERAGLRDFM
ncbi:Gfo/Idh/MocA family protein [Tunturibacter empetritectus]|uniref:Dehydrogenase n=1 Tax=Tunturiibacter lichenicola TaxID=2051959 RepID=A0A7W8N3V0_9BACT|nr:Gfo/Idh/MocA family oxidoreductase [Edaphobacter lichenicola]MBB5344897.1 putative dehydrogenase [Edaphobacter lichenicola]